MGSKTILSAFAGLLMIGSLTSDSDAQILRRLLRRPMACPPCQQEVPVEEERTTMCPHSLLTRIGDTYLYRMCYCPSPNPSQMVASFDETKTAGCNSGSCVCNCSPTQLSEYVPLSDVETDHYVQYGSESTARVVKVDAGGTDKYYRLLRIYPNGSPSGLELAMETTDPGTAVTVEDATYAAMPVPFPIGSFEFYQATGQLIVPDTSEIFYFIDKN